MGRALPALAADAAGFVLLFVAFNPLVLEFGRRTIRGGMIVLVVYVLFAYGVNALKRLAPLSGPAEDYLRPLDFSGSRPVKFALGLLVVAFFVVLQIDLNRATESMIALMTRPDSFGHEGEITLYYSFGPLFLWLMVGVLYLAAFVLPTEKRAESGSGRFIWIEFAGLLAANGMLVVSAAYLASLGGRTAGISPFLFTLAALVVLELLFDPARLRHALRNPVWWPVASYFALLLASVGLIWSSVAI